MWHGTVLFEFQGLSIGSGSIHALGQTRTEILVAGSRCVSFTPQIRRQAEAMRAKEEAWQGGIKIAIAILVLRKGV